MVRPDDRQKFRLNADGPKQGDPALRVTGRHMQGVPQVLQPGSPSLPRPGSGLFGKKVVEKYGGNLVPSADITPAPPRIVQQSTPDQKASFHIGPTFSQANDISGNASAMKLIL